MYPTGTVYQSGNRKRHFELSLKAPLLTRLLYGLVQGVGAGLIGFAVIFVIFTFGPMVKEEIKYSFGHLFQEETPRNGFGDLLNKVYADNTSNIQEEARSFNVDSYFSIVIPKIGAASNVIANVDGGNKDEYEDALTRGVAHARGTYFPGQGKNIFLFAHSTDSPTNFARYNVVFYLLGKLEVGDRITVYFADKKYVYNVSEKKIVGPEDTSWLMNTQNGEELILQTCYPPGTTLKRLLVIAKPI